MRVLPRYNTWQLQVVLQRRWATSSTSTWAWLTTTLDLALLNLWSPQEWHLLFCSCCVIMCVKSSRTQLRASENKSIRMRDMATTTRFGLLLRTRLHMSISWILHETYHVLWESASSKSSPKSLLGVMRERECHRRINRPNNSLKVCNDIIRYLLDHAIFVGGYLVNLVSHRPTCSGIRVDSFGALVQYT